MRLYYQVGTKFNPNDETYHSVPVKHNAGNYYLAPRTAAKLRKEGAWRLELRSSWEENAKVIDGDFYIDEQGVICSYPLPHRGDVMLTYPMLLFWWISIRWIWRFYGLYN